MPKEEKQKLAPKKPRKPYIRSITKLNTLRDLQVNQAANRKMDDTITNSSLDSSAGTIDSIKSPSNKDLMSILMSMKNQQCTKTDLSKLEAAVSSKIEEVKTTAETNSTKIQSLTKRLDKFESATKTSSHDSELQKQRMLKNNICIMGIPPFANEKLIDTAVKLFEVLECAIVSSGIASAYRTKGSSPIIVVKLANYDDKIRLLNAKAKKMVKVSDVAVCDESIANNYVYINNHVTPFFGKLLKEGRTCVKNKQIFACWLTSTGCVVKIEEKGEAIGFSTVQELQKIIKDRPSTSKASSAAAKRLRNGDTEQQNKNKQVRISTKKN